MWNEDDGVEIVTALVIRCDRTGERHLVSRVERRPVTDDAGVTVAFEYRVRTSRFGPYREDVSDWMPEGVALARLAGMWDAGRNARTFSVADAEPADLVARTAA